MNFISKPGRARPRKSWRSIAAAALAALIAIPALPLLGATAANAAVADVTFSNVSAIPQESRDLGDGWMRASNSSDISLWNPGSATRSAGGYFVVGFDVAIPDDAAPGDTFSITLPEFYRVRGQNDLANLVDSDGNTIATTNVTGNRTITFTLTDFLQDRIDVAGSFGFQAQEWSDPNRPAGDYVAPVVSSAGNDLIDLKIRIPDSYWAFPSLLAGWTGGQTSPDGTVEVRSLGSWDGKSDVTMTVYAGPGYDFDCSSALNQDPSVGFGIGLVDIGATQNSVPTEEWLLDPSKYTFTCDAGSFTIHMPASSWTSADSETGQVLKARIKRVANGDDSWKDDDAVFAYLTLDQNGSTRDYTNRNPRPGSTGTGESNQLPPGAFETSVFQDLNDNDVYDEGVDKLLPSVNVRVTGVTSTGSAIDTVITTTEQGVARVTLPAGEYTATIQNPPAGMAAVATDAGSDDTIDSDYTDNKVSFSVVSRETTKRDAGYRLPMSTILLSKQVTGTAAAVVADDATFTVTYAYEAGAGYEAGSGSVELPVDGTAVETDPIPVGAVVTFEEEAPAAIPGTVWADPVFSPESVTIESGSQLAEVTVTNQIDLVYGKFSILKELTGTGAGAVPEDIVYTVNYSYPAGPGYKAGSGTLDVLADGTAVESEQIPVGAVVTLSEATPADVPNVTWGEASFSPETVTIGAGEPVAVTLTNEAARDLGAFSVTKSLSGTGVERVPEGTEFTVEYSYPAGTGYEAGAGSLTVVAGETGTVEGLPAGAVVTLTEVRATDPEGGAWGEPVFDHSTFTVLADTTVAINLDNPIDLTTGQFSVLKKLAGNAADLVGEDTEFTVNYSFPAGKGFEAGEGTLTVKADGTVVTSNPLPYGAVVTLTEADPAKVKGATWGEAKFSQSEVTIGDGTTVEVTLTNTITEEPEEPGTPEKPVKKPALAITGGAGAGLLAGGAVLLLIAGAALILARRRKAHTQ